MTLSIINSTKRKDLSVGLNILTNTLSMNSNLCTNSAFLKSLRMYGVHSLHPEKRTVQRKSLSMMSGYKLLSATVGEDSFIFF